MKTSWCLSIGLVPLLLSALGCADKSDEDAEEEGSTATPLAPGGDEDGDGFTNGEEAELGSDPRDPADTPYAGGWAKSPCPGDLQVTGDRVGQTPGDFALTDQYGEEWHLHDFCASTVMLEFSGFT